LPAADAAHARVQNIAIKSDGNRQCAIVAR
jgi:hypothetical protein